MKYIVLSRIACYHTGKEQNMSSVPSISFLYNRYYSANREMRLSSTRENSHNHDVVSADTAALSKALDALDDLDFEDKEADNTKKIYNTIMSFVDTYNNAIDSAGESGTRGVSSKVGKMKQALKEYSKELDEIGITVKNSGKLSVDKSTLKTATLTKVKKVFSKDASDLSSELRKVNRNLKRQVTREVVQPVTKPEKDDYSDILGGTFNAQA